MGNGQFESSATCLSKLCNSVHIKLNGEALFNYTSLALDASSEKIYSLKYQCNANGCRQHIFLVHNVWRKHYFSCILEITNIAVNYSV